MTKVLIPDRLLAYEEHLLRALLAARGYAASFTAADPEADVILIGGPPLRPETLQLMPRLSAVIRFATGPHDLTQEEATLRRAGIAYTVIHGSSAAATAEHTIMLMLALLRRLPEAHAALLAGQWMQSEIAELGIRELAEVTVGLIGVGAVGRRVALLLKAFGARVRYHKRQRLPAADEAALGMSWAGMDALLAESDVISLHARGGAGYILGRAQLQLLCAGACVVNTGARHHVDEAALFELVQSGHLRAALDVFAAEPWHRPASIAAQKNLLLTPHIAGRSQRTARLLFGRACAELDRLLNRAPLADVAAAQHTSPLPSHDSDALLRLILKRLAPLRALAGTTAQVSNALVADLPQLPEALTALACDGVITVVDNRSRIKLTGAAHDCELQVEVPGENNRSAERDGINSAASAALRFVIDRWLVDYAIWERLLPKRARGSLPGRHLLLHGYSRQAQLLAWRAREIGLRVLVLEPDARRRLEALHEGFEIWPEDVAVGTVEAVVKADELEIGSLETTRDYSGVKQKLADEFTAWSIIALHVCNVQQQRADESADQTAVMQTIDQLFLAALAGVREGRDDTDSAVWRADGW